MLMGRSDVSLIVTSINDADGQCYKDATWQNNRLLRDLLGETAHIGSSIINVGRWTKETFEQLHSFCERDGAVYVTSAAAILSYSIGEVLAYFPAHIVEMGKNHEESEIKGYPI
jgi:hypothetical protein